MSALCDCPAYTEDQIGYHAPVDHDYDCRLPGGLTCGSCWGCAAELASRHQVLISRGPV